MDDSTPKDNDAKLPLHQLLRGARICSGSEGERTNMDSLSEWTICDEVRQLK